ncbi:MAG: T9SS type A sorting domain-containing protein [Chitinophagales bacterium]|nr:T9SS type A sorting domain-containing protein [Chitinophagales bacterium]MCZ2394526.1 T9SS type A sorting domain-containing protein [Chitinophagales bacterium]
MKKIILIILLNTIALSIAYSQNTDNCSARYREKIFDRLEYHAQVDFESWTKYHGGPVLRYNVYSPKDDTAALRPLIILWHGGAFIDAIKKNSPDIMDLVKDLAKMGYVVIAPDYRGLTDLTKFNSTEELIKIVVKSTLDANDAVCHIVSQIDNGNPYRINKNEIFAGGSSAGSIIGLHGLFLNKVEDLGEYSTWAREVDEGRIDEVLANKFCADKNIIKGFFNISGALVDTNFIQNTSTQFLHIHGTKDDFVPFDFGAPLFGATAAPNMYGSKRIHEKCLQQGVQSEFMIFENGGHVPFLNLDIKDLIAQVNFIDKEKYNRVLNGIVDFLFKQIACEKKAVSPTAIFPTNIKEINIQPNPTIDNFYISMPISEKWNFKIYHISGQIVQQGQFSGYNHQVDIAQLAKGIYITEIQNGTENNTTFIGKIIKQ